MKLQNTPEFEEFVKDTDMGWVVVGKNAYLLDRTNNVWLLCSLFKIELDYQNKIVYTGHTVIGVDGVEDCEEITSDICRSERIFHEVLEIYKIKNEQLTIDDVVIDFVINVNQFNYLAGKIEKPVQRKTLKNQVERIEEELTELRYKGVLDMNQKEILDGIVDVLVTAFGFAQLLEANGYNVAKAMQKVSVNNLTKFIDNFELANDTVKMYQDKGEECYVKNVEDCFVVLRKSDDKVMKPIGYASVDLNDCLP